MGNLMGEILSELSSPILVEYGRAFKCMQGLVRIEELKGHFFALLEQRVIWSGLWYIFNS